MTVLIRNTEWEWTHPTSTRFQGHSREDVIDRRALRRPKPAASRIQRAVQGQSLLSSSRLVAQLPLPTAIALFLRVPGIDETAKCKETNKRREIMESDGGSLSSPA